MRYYELTENKDQFASKLSARIKCGSRDFFESKVIDEKNLLLTYNDGLVRGKIQTKKFKIEFKSEKKIQVTSKPSVYASAGYISSIFLVLMSTMGIVVNLLEKPIIVKDVFITSIIFTLGLLTFIYARFMDRLIWKKLEKYLFQQIGNKYNK